MEREICLTHTSGMKAANVKPQRPLTWDVGRRANQGRTKTKFSNEGHQRGVSSKEIRNRVKSSSGRRDKTPTTSSRKIEKSKVIH